MLNPEGPMSLSRAKLAGLDIAHVKDYLVNLGWSYISSDSLGLAAAEVFRCRQPGRRHYMVLVPIDPRSDVYVSMMNDLVIEVARSEGRKGWEILNDLEKKEG